MEELVIVAIGGNSLVRDNGRDTIRDQYEAVCETAKHIADLVEQGFAVVVTHGNGPQVGFGLRRAEIANDIGGMPPLPLVNCMADTQGGIGYLIQQALINEFSKREINKKVVTVITQVEVSLDDPNFRNPRKPVGSFFYLEQAEEMKKEHPDWFFIEDSGRGYRRVVPSPKPLDILEKEAIKSLIADTLIITTGVPRVCINFGKPNQKALEKITVEETKQYVLENHFPKGSMLPKIEASLSFLENGGRKVIITNLETLKDAIDGIAGTYIFQDILSDNETLKMNSEISVAL